MIKGGGVAQLVERWHQKENQVPDRHPGCTVSVPLLIRLEIVILTPRWRFASPGHLWVCGRKN